MAEYFLDIVREGLSLNQQTVFPTILSLIYRREGDKWSREVNQTMPPELQERFLTEVSLLMWPDGSASPELVQLFADELGHRYLSKHHLLQPTLDGQLQFEHHVWRDWFMARALMERLSKSEWTPRALSSLLSDPLPEYCVSFFAMQTDQDQLKKALADPSVSDSAYSNLLRIFLWGLRGDRDPSVRAKVLAETLGSSDAFKFRRLQKVRFEMIDFRAWGFEGTTFEDVVFGFCTLPRKYEKALQNAKGVTIADCDWFPTEGLAEEVVRSARESLRNVLRRFIMSTDPLKLRDEVAKEQMSRDFHISEDDPALRCLMKLGYVRMALEASSEKYYLLDKTRLEELLTFMREGRSLERVVSCIVG